MNLAREAFLERRRAYMRRWRNANPEADKRRLRAFQLKKNFGLTIEEFEAMRVAQGNRCAMADCRQELQPGKRTHIDHDHETGRVRGILCARCNILLGIYEQLERRKAAFQAYIAEGMN